MLCHARTTHLEAEFRLNCYVLVRGAVGDGTHHSHDVREARWPHSVHVSFWFAQQSESAPAERDAGLSVAGTSLLLPRPRAQEKLQLVRKLLPQRCPSSPADIHPPCLFRPLRSRHCTVVASWLVVAGRPQPRTCKFAQPIPCAQIHLDLGVC